jgi:hypothetical protein
MPEDEEGGRESILDGPAQIQGVRVQPEGYSKRPLEFTSLHRVAAMFVFGVRSRDSRAVG